MTRWRYIPELLDRHAEDLAFLAGQRRDALHSPRHTLREFGELNERIEAHLQGLLIAPAPELLKRLGPQLHGDDRDEAFAAAYALLRRAEPPTQRAVLAAFGQAGGASLLGLRDALSLAPIDAHQHELLTLAERAPPPVAAAAAVVLANHRQLDGALPRLQALLVDEDASVCRAAWLAALHADARAGAPAHKRPYQHALGHAAPAVRHAAWAAAAWTGQAQALPLLRHVAAGDDPVALHWLAVLGGIEDVPTVQRAALRLDDAQARCTLLSRFGHPSALNALVRWMGESDVALAAASGEAFTRITGIDVRGERRALPVPDDADEFEREMAPLVWLPDAQKARALVSERGAEWVAGPRWCNGLRVDGALPADALPPFDLQARWDIGARAALAGRPACSPPPIH
jgi:uncharacterized protein (TIGR02270 family)